jgi:hypothetical protein
MGKENQPREFADFRFSGRSQDSRPFPMQKLPATGRIGEGELATRSNCKKKTPPWH